MQLGYLAFFIFGVFLDQYSKILAIRHLMNRESFPIVEGIFHLTYVENTGAAFSLLRDKTYVLTLVSLVLMGLVGYFWMKEVRNHPFMLLKLSIIMIMIGGVGNIIDRIRLGYVVDFLDFRLINFPVFNIADCFVVVGVLLYAVSIYVFKQGDIL